MGFSNLNTDAGISTLNKYLDTRSFIEGFALSQADVAVFEAVGKAPCAQKYANAARWYSNVAAHSSEHASLPGTKKAISEYGAEEENEDDDVDLFGSDESDDEELKKAKEERLAAYHAKKALKPAVIAKSSVILDVKPWDDETDLASMEKQVRGITMDGLLWGASKLVAIGYGIKKLVISCVIEDDKVGLDMICDAISELEDMVQSVDVASFNKV